MKDKFLPWLLVMTWMWMIFMMSRQTGTESAALSGLVVETFMTVFNGIGITIDEAALHTFVRKGAHAGTYLCLGAWLVNALTAHDLKPNTIILTALTLSILYAISDEIHQTFIPGRSGEINDVIIDTIGASMGILLMTILKINIRSTT